MVEAAPSAVRWYILVTCSLVTAAQMLRPPLYALLPPFPPTAFGAAWVPFWNLSATSTILLLGFVLTGGVLGDLLGRRRVLLAGAAAYLVGMALCALAQSQGWYIGASVIAGIGGAIAIPLCVALIRLCFPAGELPYAFAIHILITAVAALASSLLPGPLRGLFGWRATFAPALIVGVIGFGMALCYLPESQARGAYRPIDAVGIAAWSGLIMAVVFGLVAVRMADPSAIIGRSTLGVAAVGALLIFYWEWRSPGPILRDPPFPRAVLSIMIITGLTINFALMGYALQLFSFLQIAQQFGPIMASVGLAPLLAGLLLGSFQTARRLAVVPASRLIIGGLGLMVAAILLTGASALLWHDQVPYPGLGLWLFLFGGGFAMASTAWQTLYMGSVPAVLTGMSAAISGAAGQLGGVLASTMLSAYLLSAGVREFGARLVARGLPPELASEAKDALDRALQPEALAEPSQAQALISAALLDVYREAYATAFGQVMLVTAGVVVICTAMVWFGLRPRVVLGQRPSPTAG